MNLLKKDVVDKVVDYYMSEKRQSEHLGVESAARYEAASLLFAPYLNSRGVEVTGTENLPNGNAPYIIAANHRSILDIPVIGRALLEHDGTQVHFVAKKELFRMPGVRGYIRKSGGIRFDRNLKMDQQPEVVEQMDYVLQNKGVLGMFPEHTRREGPIVKIKKRGLGMLAVGNHVPIATAGIYGTESLFGKIRLCFGETIHTGPLGVDNRRRRMVDMEAEYTEALQAAVCQAYDLAGVDYNLFESET